MHCQLCSNEETKVLESRLGDNSVRRRRECLKCGHRFTTYEEAVFNLSVLKKDGRLENFDLQKVVRSIQKACSKTDSEMIQALSRKAEQKILRKKVDPIRSTEIGRIVLQELKRFDKIAYLRFASVHKEINDPKLLGKELSLLVS